MREKKGKLYFNFIKLGNDLLLANEVGDWLMLKKEEFKFDDLDNLDSALYKRLEKSGLIIKTDKEIEIAAGRTSRAYDILGKGTYLHIIIPTKRCNQLCIYCHASSAGPKAKNFDMNLETAEKTMERIFETKADNIQVEIQGGEPLLNWPVVEFIVNKVKEKRHATGKNAIIRICTNLLLLTEKKAEFLVKNNVFFSTSLDGHKFLQDHNRPQINKEGSFTSLMQKIERLRELQIKYKNHMILKGAIVTVSTESLKYPKEIVDAFVANGFMSMYIRPLFPLGRGGAEKHYYSVDDYFAFYEKVLDRIYFWEKKGHSISESYLKFILKKFFRTPDHTMHCDLRSPCGAGIGQLAYNYDGKVYTCDDARSLPEKYLPMFEVGNVFDNSLSDYINSPAVKACAASSCLDNVPVCSDCAYKPYCSVCPVYNIVVDGDIFPRPGNFRCQLHKKMLNYIFLAYKNNNQFLINFFKKMVQ